MVLNKISHQILVICITQTFACYPNLSITFSKIILQIPSFRRNADISVLYYLGFLITTLCSLSFCSHFLIYWCKRQEMLALLRVKWTWRRRFLIVSNKHDLAKLVVIVAASVVANVQWKTWIQKAHNLVQRRLQETCPAVGSKMLKITYLRSKCDTGPR